VKLELTDEQYDKLKHILKETAECPVATCDSYCAFCDHVLSQPHARVGETVGCSSDCPERHDETCPVLEAQSLWNEVVYPIEDRHTIQCPMCGLMTYVLNGRLENHCPQATDLNNRGPQCKGSGSAVVNRLLGSTSE
jgi:hypothetical protein